MKRNRNKFVKMLQYVIIILYSYITVVNVTVTVF